MSAPIPFKSANVPIIGQPFTLRQWFPTVVANCSCESKHALVVQGIGNVAVCPDCKRGLVITGMGVDPSGTVGVQVAPVIARPSNGQDA